jgi:hypothetical protein
MSLAVKTGNFVHIVATINMETGEGRILYVNPATSTIASTAARDPNVEILAENANGTVIHRENAVVRRSSYDPKQPHAVGLIQADIPQDPTMTAVTLRFKGKEVSRYQAGEMAPLPPGGVSLSAGPVLDDKPNKRSLTIAELAQLGPAPGVTYTIQVKPDTGGPWHTIAVGRKTPHVELDRNQFAGAKSVTVRVLRTTGFQEEVLAEETLDLS